MLLNWVSPFAVFGIVLAWMPLWIAWGGLPSPCKSSLIKPEVKSDSISAKAKTIPKPQYHQIPYKVTYENDRWSTIMANFDFLPGEEFHTEVLQFSRIDYLSSSLDQSLVQKLVANPDEFEEILRADHGFSQGAYLVDQFILSSVQFANKKMEKRRGWGQWILDERRVQVNTFSQKNIKKAKEYAEYSGYVTVRQNDGSIIGSIRNIEILDTPDSQLPEEEYLKIKLARMGLLAEDFDQDYFQNEIGNYAVEESLSRQLHGKVILELWGQLIRFLMSHEEPGQNHFNQAFHTYGDTKSLELYAPLGFRKLRVYQHNGQWVDYSHLAEKDVPGIVVKEGEEEIEWWPLVLLPEGVEKLNGIFTNRGISQVGGDWLVQRRRDLADEYMGAYQMGALIPHLVEDLGSNTEHIYLNAMDGLLNLLESYLQHHKNYLAHGLIEGNDRRDKKSEITHFLKKNTTKVKGLIGQIIDYLEQKILASEPVDSNWEDGIKLTHLGQFTAFLLRLDDDDHPLVPKDQIIKRLLWPILEKGDMLTTRFTFFTLNTGRMSSKGWLKSLGVIVDRPPSHGDFQTLGVEVSEGDEPVRWVRQVQEAMRKSRTALESDYMTGRDLDRIVKLITANLFEPQTMPEVKPWEDFPTPVWPIWQFLALKLSAIQNKTPMFYRHLFILASAKSFLENQSK